MEVKVQNFVKWLKEKSHKKAKNNENSEMTGPMNGHMTVLTNEIKGNNNVCRASMKLPPIPREERRKLLASMTRAMHTDSPAHVYEEIHIPGFEVFETGSKRCPLPVDMPVESLDFSHVQEIGPYFLVPMKDSHNSHLLVPNNDSLRAHRMPVQQQQHQHQVLDPAIKAKHKLMADVILDTARVNRNICQQTLNNHSHHQHHHNTAFHTHTSQHADMPVHRAATKCMNGHVEDIHSQHRTSVQCNCGSKSLLMYHPHPDQQPPHTQRQCGCRTDNTSPTSRGHCITKEHHECAIPEDEGISEPVQEPAAFSQQQINGRTNFTPENTRKSQRVFNKTPYPREKPVSDTEYSEDGHSCGWSHDKTASESSNDTFSEYDIGSANSSLRSSEGQGTEYDFYLSKAKLNLMLKDGVKKYIQQSESSETENEAGCHGDSQDNVSLTTVTSLSEVSMILQDKDGNKTEISQQVPQEGATASSPVGSEHSAFRRIPQKNVSRSKKSSSQVKHSKSKSDHSKHRRHSKHQSNEKYLDGMEFYELPNFDTELPFEDKLSCRATNYQPVGSTYYQSPSQCKLNRSEIYDYKSSDLDSVYKYKQQEDAEGNPATGSDTKKEKNSGKSESFSVKNPSQSGQKRLLVDMIKMNHDRQLMVLF